MVTLAGLNPPNWDQTLAGDRPPSLFSPRGRTGTTGSVNQLLGRRGASDDAAARKPCEQRVYLSGILRPLGSMRAERTCNPREKLVVELRRGAGPGGPRRIRRRWFSMLPAIAACAVGLLLVGPASAAPNILSWGAPFAGTLVNRSSQNGTGCYSNSGTTPLFTLSSGKAVGSVKSSSNSCGTTTYPGSSARAAGSAGVLLPNFNGTNRIIHVAVTWRVDVILSVSLTGTTCPAKAFPSSQATFDVGAVFENQSTGTGFIGGDSGHGFTIKNVRTTSKAFDYNVTLRWNVTIMHGAVYAILPTALWEAQTSMLNPSTLHHFNCVGQAKISPSRGGALATLISVTVK
jgi:hypothetical protein